MKILNIIGTRPQYIKLAPVSKVLRQAGHQEILVDTGQHYDKKMSSIFFKELHLSHPAVCLRVGSGSHAWQTARMMEQIERIIETQRPDHVLVYGDTNSTLAGALAASKLPGISLGHIEAGMRSYNRSMPEEINRIVVDHCSNLHFCVTKHAVENLAHEGIKDSVHLVGDTMYDAVCQFLKIAQVQSKILETLRLKPKNYLLATVHRPSNTDSVKSLRSILKAFQRINDNVIFPVHPRTQKKIAEANGLARSSKSNIKMIKPVGYLDMLILEKNAKAILTDSGGVQKEAYYLGTPCLTLRSETEWQETVDSGWNVLIGKKLSQIPEKLEALTKLSSQKKSLFGNGKASESILKILEKTK